LWREEWIQTIAIETGTGMILFGRELVWSTVLVTWLALLQVEPSPILVAAVGPNSLSQATHQIVIGVDGGAESIRACCFDATGKAIGEPCAVAYPTQHPAPGWAEQHPADCTKILDKQYEVLCSLPLSGTDTKYVR
jgi:hypothetical protein